jgi:hypothetical protein
MAKKQTRRSISVSRTTYERLKAFCETNNISMSQLVETRVNDFLGTDDVASVAMMPAPAAFRPLAPTAPMTPRVSTPAVTSVPAAKPIEPRMASNLAAPATHIAATAPAPAPAPAVTSAHSAPMTSAAARFAVEPPLPIIKPRQDTAAPKPAEKRPEQIFTF